MKNPILFLIALLAILNVQAQNYGEIHGRIVDSKSKEPLPFANVWTEYGGQTMGTVTDDDGRFKLKPLQPSVYNLNVSYLGYQPRKLSEVHVHSNRINPLGEIPLSTENELIGIEIVGHQMINKDDPNVHVIKADQIKTNAMLRSPAQLIGTLAPGLITNEYGQFIVRGSRPGTTSTFIDGVKLSAGLGNLPGTAIKSISIYTGGIPAKYGDITGGVVIIETKSYFDYYNEHLAKQR